MSIKHILKEFAKGKIAVVFDDINRENEADLVIAVEKANIQQLSFLIKYGRGLLCAAYEHTILENLGICAMPTNNKDKHSTAFMLSLDHKTSTTGISCEERLKTAQNILEPNAKLSDFITPGHLFILKAHPEGLLARRGHTEASVFMCKATNLKPAAFICEMIKDDGTMFSYEEAKEFAKQHKLPFVNIKDLVEYQKLTYSNVIKTAQSELYTEYGKGIIAIYKEIGTNKEHVFLSLRENYLNGYVRIHSECFTGDLLSSLHCDCGNQLHQALRIISQNGGSLVYLKQEGRNIGLSEKIKAYKLQQTQKLDTAEANLALGHKDDERDYHQACWILKNEGYKTIKLISNNPQKVNTLKMHGFKIQQIIFKPYTTYINKEYLLTKKTKFNHNIELEDLLHA